MAAVDVLRARLSTLLGRLACSPSELTALALLVLGGLGLLAFLWWAAPGTGSEPLPPAEASPGGAESQVGAEGGDPPLAVEADELVVHVSGAVASSGVRAMPAGSRVADALDAAGGAQPDAALETVNLARPLRDGQQLHVPDQAALEEASHGRDGPAGAGLPAVRPHDGRIDLNRARAGDLERLPGVGPVLAERIVSHRDEHGPFTEPEGLLDVPGIGERTLETFADLVDV